MLQYKSLIRKIVRHGELRDDRTGVGRRSIFGHQIRIDLALGFPLITIKKVHWKSVVHELLWFISGDTNIGYLKANNVSIWDEWADGNGDLGPVYGKQWRNWEGKDGAKVDQLRSVIDQIKTSPSSSRLIVSAWNVSDLKNMALPPCHMMFQFFVTSDRRLSVQIYQRSADVFLGVPFNLASYALLLIMIANECYLTPGELIWTSGDAHLYENHLTQAKEILARKEKKLPQVRMKAPPGTPVEVIKYEDIELVGYDPHPPIRATVAI